MRLIRITLSELYSEQHPRVNNLDLNTTLYKDCVKLTMLLTVHELTLGYKRGTRHNTNNRISIGLHAKNHLTTKLQQCKRAL